jgi:hypothetical protein
VVWVCAMDDFLAAGSARAETRSLPIMSDITGYRL